MYIRACWLQNITDWPPDVGVLVCVTDFNPRLGFMAKTYRNLHPYRQKHVQEARSLNQIQGRTPFESQSSRFAHSIYI